MSDQEIWPESTAVEPAPVEAPPRKPHWQPQKRNMLAMDRHIELLYGRDAVARSRR